MNHRQAWTDFVTKQQGLTPADAPVKRPKYGNQKTEVHGIVCDSKKEAARWAQLVAMKHAGLISDLFPHPSFPLYVNGTRVGRFSADALYVEEGQLVIEDVKSRPTAMATAYRQRVKMFLACYPHAIVREWFG
jgi:aspartate/methionine/tyrosine aminotransferase